MIDIPERGKKKKKRRRKKKKKKREKRESIPPLQLGLTGGILSGMRNTWRTTFWQPLVYSILKKKKKGKGKVCSILPK